MWIILGGEKNEFPVKFVSGTNGDRLNLWALPEEKEQEIVSFA